MRKRENWLRTSFDISYIETSGSASEKCFSYGGLKLNWFEVVLLLYADTMSVVLVRDMRGPLTIVCEPRS
jgi:hypothetical protein